VIAPAAERGGTRPRPREIGRAALTIGVITVVARAVGFGRQVVFAHTVGTSCLGTAYTTANMVPNIIYDIVLGGALSSVVVPVLAGPAELSRAQVRQIASALLTWTVLLLVPVSGLLAVTARPVLAAALSGAGGCPPGALAGAGARMLMVFAPQVLLYGLAVVLYGILQAHRRFGAPALAPLLSSLVVVGAYAGFGLVASPPARDLTALPAFPEYLLSGGTTLGVVALVATALVPAWRLRLAPRPTLRFPPGVGSRVRKLALAGVAALVAQDASVAVVIVLANRFGHSGALVLYNFAWSVFVVPFAVLAVPIATSAFPELSARSGEARAAMAGSLGARRRAGRGRRGAVALAAAGPAGAGPAVVGSLAAAGGSASQGHAPGSEGDPGRSPAGAIVPGQAVAWPSGAAPSRGGRGGTAFDLTAAASTRAVLLASMLGAAALAGARTPLSRVFESHSPASAWVLATSLAFFAPALVGYGLSANLSRVLYALGRSRAPALAVAGGWLLVIAADVAIVPFIPRARVVPALGLGTTIGLTAAGIALLVLVYRERGRAPLAGLGRAFGAGLAGCAAAAIAGSAVALVVRAAGFLPNVGLSLLVSAIVAVVFALVVVNLDGGDARAAFRRLRAPRPR
jgi:putative peptidoglycan lipid II flippase